MPRIRRMIDRLMMREGRNVGSMPSHDSRRMMMDRAMHEGYPYEHQMEDMRRNTRGQYIPDRRYEREIDSHYGTEGKTYYPIEAMGSFNGYWGRPQSDYGYDMRYDMRGHQYEDYGESLNREELEHWNKKLMKEIDEQYKYFFTKENIIQKANQLGIHFDKFNEDELLVATAMIYTDYCETLKPLVGTNMDIYVKLARDWLVDPDTAIKGGEKLAIYHDCIVEGDDD